MLTRGGKAIRLAVMGAVVVGLLWGTGWGNDVHFPFGPFRMYSTSTRDRINVMEFHGITRGGARVELHPQDFGMRRAELEGQRRKLEHRPDLLRYIVESYESFTPDGPLLRELQIVHSVYILVEGRPVWERDRVLARWIR